ncbi:hypothetical protein [Deinococcus radiotolerans]|uniref:Uncharacterized protein n=1 Tax=Deinococcus radiotolerans TaxID=1309407 RepID=A0ABQ2FQD2_9DEIO|nr:hypothetical protein [Deinococcus radiotolerans]GGL16618.1 hypothetical protein GCM10010844_39430 [Deinococcus radiotolerans]
MISPVLLSALLPRMDLARIHFTPTQLPPRHTSDGLTLMREAIAHLQVFVVRIERGVPTRVLRPIAPSELGTHRLVPGVTAYAWAFTHHEAGQAPRTFMLVVAQSEVRAPHPNESIDFWGQHGPIHGGREIPDRPPPKPARAAAPAPPQPPQAKPKPPQARPAVRAGKKGPKNKGRRRR